jgi:hypothetical protein
VKVVTFSVTTFAGERSELLARPVASDHQVTVKTESAGRIVRLHTGDGRIRRVQNAAIKRHTAILYDDVK